MLFIQTKNRYYHSHFHSSPSLEKEMPFRHSYSNNGDSLKKIYLSESSSRATSNYLRNQGSRLDTIIETETKVTLKPPSIKRILLVDDDPDITLTFKAGLDGHYYGYGDKKKRFEVYTYNDPLLLLKEFKPHFYDLLLTDIDMPNMNGFQLCEKLLELDVNIRVCFMSALELNIQALREVYPNVSFGCYIEMPVTIEYLIKRLSAELD
jgi:CheY-like chemotaxis protein